MKTAYTLLCRFIVGLLLLGSSSLFADYEPIDKVAIVVDNDIITQSDIDKKMTLAKQNLASQQGEAPPEAFIRDQVIDRLILESLQLQLAEKTGVNISDERLNLTLSNMAQRNGFSSLQEFQQELLKEGMDYQVLREQVRNEMIMQQVQQGFLRNKVQVSDQEVENFLDSEAGKAITTRQFNISHVLIPVPSGASNARINKLKDLASSLKKQLDNGSIDFKTLVQGRNFDNVAVSGQNFGMQPLEDLPSLFAKKAEKMKAGEVSAPLRSGAGWHLVKVHQISGGSEIVYQVNARHILVKPSEVRDEEQTRKLIDSLYQRLQDGESFELLAKEYSEDNGSALQGGNLGWSDPGQYVPAFRNTLANMAIGDVSTPFKSRYGWHIIEKLGERDHDITQENWQNEAYQTLFERKFKDELDAWLVKIKEEAFIEYK